MHKDWDKNITSKTCKMWAHWKTQITRLKNIVIPRKVLCSNPRLELHGFCDASKAALAYTYVVSIPKEHTW